MAEAKKDTVKETVEKTMEDATQQANAMVEDFTKAGEDMTASVRKVAEQGVTNFRKAYDGLKDSAESTTDMLEDTLAAASNGVNQLNLKALDNFKAQTDAGFAFARSLLGAKSPAEAFELQTSFARDSLQMLTQQSKAYAELAGEVATAAVKPAKENVVKTVKSVSAAAA